MPPMPADADAPLDLETPGTASAAASAVRASASRRVNRGHRGIEEIEVRHDAGQHVRLGEAGEAILRRGTGHRNGALGERLHASRGQIVGRYQSLPAAHQDAQTGAVAFGAFGLLDDTVADAD